jgi:glycosyltransferase involved in cell wall biosynthesis
MSTGTEESLHVVMTIASLVPEAGGPSRTVPGMAEALARAGCRVDLVSVGLGDRLGAPLLPPREHVRTEMVPTRISRGLRPIWTPAYRSAIERRLEGTEVEVLHDNGVWLPTNHAAVRAGIARGVPVVVSTRGMLMPWSVRIKSWRKRLAWRLYQRADLMDARVLHATSVAEAQGLRDLGLDRPIAVIPNGVHLPPSRACRPGASGARTALFLSRVVRNKGLLELVDAWASLRPAGWRVVIAGPDAEGHRAEVEAAVRAAGLVEAVDFVGAVDGAAKWELFRRADLFVLPTHNENFGLVVAEALGCGLPVVTTRGAPWGDLVTHRCGWWVDHGVGPLTEALREALSLPVEERAAMGARGRDFVERQFSWPGVAERMVSVYRWVLSGGPTPDCVNT